MPVIFQSLTTTAVENHGGDPMLVDSPAPQPQLSNSMMNSIIAGYTAGVVGTLVGHPMDSLKVWMQTSSTIAGSSSTTVPKTASSRNYSPRISTQHMSTLAAPVRRPMTLRALYAGVGGPLVTVGILQSANFCLYDSFRQLLHRKDTDYRTNDSIANVAMSALFTGTIMSVFTSPLFVVKTKQQIMTWNFQTAVRNVAASGGFGGFFVGFGPHFINETVGRAVYFCTYEAVKR